MFRLPRPRLPYTLINDILLSNLHDSLDSLRNVETIQETRNVYEAIMSINPRPEDEPTKIVVDYMMYIVLPICRRKGFPSTCLPEYSNRQRKWVVRCADCQRNYFGFLGTDGRFAKFEKLLRDLRDPGFGSSVRLTGSARPRIFF
ncbi:MAG: hypothetical protein Q9159_001967 [Coniocarpon cinnabarinum]